MADKPDMKKLLEQAMLEQKEAFRQKFGRDPQPGDPVFFDPDNDHPDPVGLSEGKLVKETIVAMEKADVPPQIIYAYKRTGLLLSEGHKDNYDPDAVAEGTLLSMSTSLPSMPTVPKTTTVGCFQNNTPSKAKRLARLPFDLREKM